MKLRKCAGMFERYVIDTMHIAGTLIVVAYCVRVSILALAKNLVLTQPRGKIISSTM